MNQELSDNVLDNFYTQVLQEQTRLMGEMRNSPEKFKDNEVSHGWSRCSSHYDGKRCRCSVA
jgi:hypothetical protein